MTETTPRVLDVRPLPYHARHTAVFGLIDQLEPAEALRVVNDHDPVPLLRRIEARAPGAFSVTCLIGGPDIWQVEIRRAGAAATVVEHDCSCGCSH